MKFLERIRAIFNFKGQRAEMELKSAEIRGNKVYLHPADDPDHTFCVSGKKIDILIDPAVELTEDDFFVIENEKLTKLRDQMEIDSQSPTDKLLQPQTSPKENSPRNQRKLPSKNLMPSRKKKLIPRMLQTKTDNLLKKRMLPRHLSRRLHMPTKALICEPSACGCTKTSTNC